MTKLSEEQIRYVRKQTFTYGVAIRLARKFGVEVGVIYRAKKKKLPPEKKAKLTPQKRMTLKRQRERKTFLQKTYGITIEEYDALLEQQGGVCRICQKPCKTGRPLAVDHCHDTKKVRGLLCRKCNVGLGMLEDSQELLKRALDYLECN